MHSQLKICLVTWYGSNNYGTNLQAYALYTFLKGMGHRVDLIRPFRGRRMFHQYPGMPNESVRSLKGVLKSILGMRTPENIRQGKIMKFLKKEFSFAPLVRDENGIAEINAGYDCFVTGSDQIWNPYNLDTFYLLDFVKEDAKKIAYSSSVAVNTIPEDLIPTYRHYLSQFKALSCRERTGAELLSRLLNRPVKTVLDPVLLLDGQTWVEFSQKSIYNRIKSVTEPFIFCYFIGDKDFEWKALSEIKHKIGISKVIVFSVSPSRYNNTEYEYMRTADIYDFVWFLHQACYVVTDSFHNIALSIRLKKEFVALMRCDNDVKSENSRVSDFLETFDIGFKTYMPASDNYLAPIPYDSVSCLLDKKIRECKNYLEDALI